MLSGELHVISAFNLLLLSNCPEQKCVNLCCRYGEIVNINLVRDKATGKPKGFCFLAYEDQRSTVLAVDNLNGFKVLYTVHVHVHTMYMY